RSLGPLYTELGRDAASLLRDLSVRAGVFVPETLPRDGQNPDYLFLHRTVAEYLVAHHLAGLPRSDWQAVVEERMWFDASRPRVLALLAAVLVRRARPGEAVHLVALLLDQAHDPFDRALFTAVRVAAELPDRDLLPAMLADAMAGRIMRRLDGAAGRDRA